MMATSWLVRSPCAAPRLRLFCFSYAGGSAGAYAQWQQQLGPHVEVCAVQLPGRGARMGEAPLTSLAQVASAVADVIARQGPLPYACFGHSLGALLAFEVARCSHRLRLPLPLHLFVSGSDAPAARSGLRQLHLLPDAQLIDALRQYNGTPAELLEHRELMALVLPAIRADFGLVETYAYQPWLRLPVPLTVLAGRDDAHVAGARLAEWGRETARDSRIAWFDGGHFFVNEQRAAVLECVAATLEQLPVFALECGTERMAS